MELSLYDIEYIMTSVYPSAANRSNNSIASPTVGADVDGIIPVVCNFS